MLLDSFLEGFLHTLFLQKWARFGRAAHTLLRALELIYLVALLAMTVRGSRRLQHHTSPHPSQHPSSRTS